MRFFNHVLQLLRPVQWIKNLLVFSGIIFAGHFLDSALWIKALIVALAFCFVSSSIYVINDILDCENDKIHPKKQHRPIASGAITKMQGVGIASIFSIAGLLIGLFVSIPVFIILLSYFLLNIAYSFYFKHVVILDVFCISLGFMLRLLAGTIGLEIPPSRWILLCGIMVTLFLGFAKRRAELISKQFVQQDHRQVLTDYNVPLLDQMITICIAGTILTYSLYTMSADTIAVHHTENLIFTVPFVIYALFRYLFIIHVQKEGGDPTQNLLKDRHIAVAFLTWLTLIITIIQG